MNHHAKFEIDRIILKCLNQQKELTVPDGRTDTNHNKDLLLKSVKSSCNLQEENYIGIHFSNYVFISIAATL